MKKNLPFILVFLILLFFACKKSTFSDPPVNDPSVNDTETVTASISGVVVNENDVPVSGATVKLGSTTITTNAYGVFRFNNVVMSKNNAHVKVTKSGYFNGNRSLMATAGRTHTVRIKLQPKTNTGTISGSGGGFVALPTGGRVTFPANAITDASGNAYTGTVNVAMAWINPTANDLGSIIQGDLRGVTTNNTERVLETYGMLGVELTGAGGQELKIASGKTAELSIPIPVSLQSSAPASIPLWHFDEVSGRWKEEGSANKVGNNYVGTVKHFSFWNCDISLMGINLCVNVTNTAGQPLNNVTVKIKRQNSNGASVGYGTTDSLGNVCGLVPINELLTLEILGNCGGVVHTQNIGPYATNGNVNVVVNTVGISVNLTGNVLDCNNAPIMNGMVLLALSNGFIYNAQVTNGNFSLNILNCNSPFNYSIVAVDNSTQQQGIITTGSIVNSGTQNIGTLSACGSSTSQMIYLTVDGILHTFEPVIDSFKSWHSVNANNTPGNTFIVRALKFNNLNYGISFAFYLTPTGNAIGNYYLTNLNIGIPSTPNMFANEIYPNGPIHPQTYLSELGQLGLGYISGSFSKQVLFSTGYKNVSCTFRVKRN